MWDLQQVKTVDYMGASHFVASENITLEQWVKTHCYKIICDILRCTRLHSLGFRTKFS